MVYQKPLSRLVEEVRAGKDKSLFDAVRIDRTIIACPTIAHRISLAEFEGDQDFFKKLQNALKGTPQKHWAYYYDRLRYIMVALIETGAGSLNGEGLEHLFVDHLGLFPDDPDQDIRKSLLKHYSATKKKLNHLK